MPDRDDRAREGAEQVGPPRRPVAEHQGRAQGPGRVHGGAADRRAPQAGQGDVAADADARRSGPSCCAPEDDAEDGADQPGGEHDLPHHRGERWRCRGPGSVRPALPCLPSSAHSSSVARTAPSELGDDVGGHPPPGEVAAQREGDADRRVQVGARDRAHEQDDRGTISAGATTSAPYGHGRAAEPRVDHAAADGDQHQEERPEQLGEQPPPLVAARPRSRTRAASSSVCPVTAAVAVGRCRPPLLASGCRSSPPPGSGQTMAVLLWGGLTP